MQFATKHAVTVEHLWHVLNVQSWLEHTDITNKNELRKLCDSIVSRASWRELICMILNNPEHEQFFYASNTASRLNLDVSELIYKAIKQNPIKHSGYLDIVYGNPEYAQQLTKIYEKVLPLDDMATGMGDCLFAPNLSQEHHCLDFVLQELKKYPKMGEQLIQTALQSPVVRERNGACAALEEWSKLLNRNLQVISPGLYSVLKDIAAIEVNPDTKKNMKKLLKI